MIADKDRSGYIGASDTEMVVGNWKTKTWENWWREKLGIVSYHFENKYTQAGSQFEHRIMESLNIPGMRLDEQIIKENLLLRVNYDGTTKDCIYECKTYRLVNGFKLREKYIQQVQVEMYAKGIFKAKIVAYGLQEEDYGNFFRPIDPVRIQIFDVPYDSAWISGVYLPRLQVLTGCLRKKVFPGEGAKGGLFNAQRQGIGVCQVPVLPPGGSEKQADHVRGTFG